MEGIFFRRAGRAALFIGFALFAFFPSGPVSAQVWSIESCADCHGDPPVDALAGVRNAPPDVGAVAGSHGAHNAACSACHIEPNRGPTPPAAYDHSDGTIDMNPAVGYSRGVALPQDRNVTLGDLGTCLSASCHDDGTGIVESPRWGVVITDCSECHPTRPATGSHTGHFNSTVVSGANVPVCGDCHDGALEGSTPPSGHRNAVVDVYDINPGDLGWNSGTKTCGTAYCHSDGKGNHTAVTWGDTSTGCDFCHGAPPTATNPGHPNDPFCSNCHVGVAPTNDAFLDPSSHINGPGGDPPMACNTCHGYPPVPSDGIGSGGGYVAHVEGKGAHAKHVQKLVDLEGRIPDPLVDSFGDPTVSAICGTCHDLGIGHMTGIHIDPAARADRQYWFDALNPPLYNGAVDIPSSVQPKTCSRISCHFNDTPVWAEPTGLPQ